MPTLAKVDQSNTEFIYCLYVLPLNSDAYAISPNLQIPHPSHRINDKYKKIHFRHGIRVRWCLHQMAAPRREPGSRFLSCPNKSSLGRCCHCSHALGSWPTSPAGSTGSVFVLGKSSLEQLPSPAMRRSLRPLQPPGTAAGV